MTCRREPRGPPDRCTSSFSGAPGNAESGRGAAEDSVGSPRSPERTEASRVWIEACPSGLSDTDTLIGLLPRKTGAFQTAASVLRPGVWPVNGSFSVRVLQDPQMSASLVTSARQSRGAPWVAAANTKAPDVAQAPF